MIFGSIPAYLRDRVLACPCRIIHRSGAEAGACAKRHPADALTIAAGLREAAFDVDEKSVETWSVDDRVATAWWLRLRREEQMDGRTPRPLALACLRRRGVGPVHEAVVLSSFLPRAEDADARPDDRISQWHGRIRAGSDASIVGLDIDGTTADVMLERILVGDRILFDDPTPRPIRIALHGAAFIDFRAPLTNESQHLPALVDVVVSALVGPKSVLTFDLRGQWLTETTESRRLPVSPP